MDGAGPISLDSLSPPVDPTSEPTILDPPDLSLPPRKDDAWRREQRAFRAMLPSLLATHRDQYAAVHNGLKPLIADLSDDAVKQLIDFAQLLACEDERDAWHRFGRAQFIRASGSSEPESTLSDIKPLSHFDFTL